MKLFQLFKTLDERKEFIDELKARGHGKVCFRTTTKQLAKDTYLTKSQIEEYKYAVVYEI